jgi:hypothetical protein
MTAEMELGGGGAQAWREEGKSGDWCGGGRARASAFYRGRREVEAAEEGGGGGGNGISSLPPLPGVKGAYASELRRGRAVGVAGQVPAMARKVGGSTAQHGGM